jgi:hypothetical protein
VSPLLLSRDGYAAAGRHSGERNQPMTSTDKGDSL